MAISSNSAQGSISMTDVQKYLSTPENPVSISEFREFWMSCSREEKDEYMLQVERDLED